eukprot:scaffold27485_cov17-Tisochrysis_lutea.AAC.1
MPVTKPEHPKIGISLGKEKAGMLFPLQEFDVDPKRTVREEFYQVYDQQVRAILALEPGHLSAKTVVGQCALHKTCTRIYVRVHACTLQAVKRQEQLSAQLESAGEDMARMQAILDELDKLNNKVGSGCANRCGLSRKKLSAC